jgi:predicted amino acid-binding ACT domain protein
MKVKVTINILNLIGTIIALFVTMSILNGSAQEVVHFAGVANEIGTAFMSLMLTIGLAYSSFERIK